MKIDTEAIKQLACFKQRQVLHSAIAIKEDRQRTALIIKRTQRVCCMTTRLRQQNFKKQRKMCYGTPQQDKA